MTQAIVRRALEAILEPLLDQPDLLRINLLEVASSILAEIEVHPDDIPKIIGKSGRTIGAIHIIMTNIGAKNKTRIRVLINE